MAVLAVSGLGDASHGANGSVTVRGVQFSPATVTVEVGDDVVWYHDDGAIPHTVTADDGSFDSHPQCLPAVPSTCMTQGQTFSRKFAAASTIRYHCKVHPSMTGDIVVTADVTTTSAGAPSPPPSTTTTGVAPAAPTGVPASTSTGAPTTVATTTTLAPAPTAPAGPSTASTVRARAAGDRHDDSGTSRGAKAVAVAIAAMLATGVAVGVLRTRKGRP